MPDRSIDVFGVKITQSPATEEAEALIRRQNCSFSYRVAEHHRIISRNLSARLRTPTNSSALRNPLRFRSPCSVRSLIFYY